MSLTSKIYTGFLIFIIVGSLISIIRSRIRKTKEPKQSAFITWLKHFDWEKIATVFLASCIMIALSAYWIWMVLPSPSSKGPWYSTNVKKDGNGPYHCYGKNDTCPNYTYNYMDLYCDKCDPDGDNREG